MKGLTGRRVILTGGASGIGRAAALRLGAEGCVVGIFDLNGAGAAETAQAIEAAGGSAASWALDISDYAAVQQAHDAFEARFGPVEGLANVAGWDAVRNFLDTDTAFWDKIVRINLYGPLTMHHVVLKGMAARGFGRVVNVASDAGRVGSSGEAVYSACKGGIIAFTKTMAREMARKGVTVNVLCPGPTDTPILQSFFGAGDAGAKIAEGLKSAIPLKRIGQPEDYAGMLAFLLSDEGAYMTGQTLSISGGLTMNG
ncbi:SDR family oxidoreductase [Pseudorhodoferax sp.]|uniref:SDR family oxidoreductase n=1 Tax=Pseudorhodoferax sp. TaxID=1993553 RepID=UPI002DD62810|nr:SDR family oxidoreductase [Pseudorhodoferax sp.]